MTKNGTLIALGIGVSAFCAGYFVGKWKTERDLIEDVQEWQLEDFLDVVDAYADTDGDDIIVNPNTRQYTEVDSKPDIFEIGKRAYQDYSRFTMSHTEPNVVEGDNSSLEIDAQGEIVTLQTSGKKIIKNIFEETQPYIEIVDEAEAKELVANGYDTLTATYFLNDDIIAGFDNELEPLDEKEWELTEGIQALVNNGSDGSVFLRNDSVSVVYELVLSSESYEESKRELK